MATTKDYMATMEVSDEDVNKKKKKNDKIHS